MGCSPNELAGGRRRHQALANNSPFRRSAERRPDLRMEQILSPGAAGKGRGRSAADPQGRRPSEAAVSLPKCHPLRCDGSPARFPSIGSRTVPSISWPVSGRLKSAFYSRRWMRTEVTHKRLDRSRIRLTGLAPQWPNLSATLGYKLIVSGASGSGLFEGRFIQIRASVAAVSRAAVGHIGRRWSAGCRQQIGAAPSCPRIACRWAA